MEIQQYYYTSYVQQKTGKAGFQIKAMSPGISSLLQSAIARLIDYRIPPDLNVNAVETHPVALRYASMESGESVLLCSQSSGQDEYGRPGNFFAHALVLQDRSLFTTIPPIFFWKSPLWRAEDSQERQEVVSLPVLPFLEIEPRLDGKEIRRFLVHEARYNWLYLLLCAVLQYGKTQRRIIICDTNEHIALWIAAVSYLLPPAYRPLLTFATYHHDPGHAAYLITGTTSQSQLRAILADSHLYFLLNTATGSVSPVEPSPYAWMVSQALRSDRYEDGLLPLLTTFARHFSQSAAIDEQLDLLALYTRLQLSPTQEKFTEETHQAIQATLTSFATRSQLSTKDIDELSQVERHLRGAAKHSTQSDVHGTYQGVLALLKEHYGLIDDIILEELKLLAELFSVSQPHTHVSMSLSVLHDLYGAQNIIHTMNSTAYLQWAAQSVSENIRANLECLIALIGGNITPEQFSQMQRTLESLSIEEYMTILEYCLPKFLLHTASSGAHLNLIHALFPRGRQLMLTEHFWQMYLNTLGNLFQHPSTAERAVGLLDFWFTTPPYALPEGYPAQHFFLLLPGCESLQADQFQEANTHRSSAPPRLWQSSIRFALAQRTNLITITNHSGGKYPGKYFLALREKMGRARQKDHLRTIHLLDTKVSRLFEKNSIIEQHGQLTSLYKEFSAEYFWASYWKHFFRLLTTRESESVLAVFSFWFERSYDTLEFIIPQEFFLGIFRIFRSASKVQGFYETMQDIDEKAQQEETVHSGELFPWLPLITSLARWRQQ